MNSLDPLAVPLLALCYCTYSKHSGRSSDLGAAGLKFSPPSQND